MVMDLLYLQNSSGAQLGRAQLMNWCTNFLVSVPAADLCALQGAKLHCLALHYTALYCIALYGATLHCTELNCTKLQVNALN